MEEVRSTRNAVISARAESTTTELVVVIPEEPPIEPIRRTSVVFQKTKHETCNNLPV